MNIDKNKEGKVQRVQLLRLVESLHHKNALMFKQVICPPTDEGSLIDYEEVRKMIADYPYMLEPAFRLQTTLRRRIMGEKFWRKKQTLLLNIDKDRELKRVRKERQLLKERNFKVRAEVGWVSYYFSKRARERAANQFPLPVVTLNEKGDVKVGWQYALIAENYESK